MRSPPRSKTGAPTPRAVRPEEAGGGKTAATPIAKIAARNCTATTARNCGQVAVDYRRSFRHVIADVAESFLNWDSKFTKTIGLLLISPGWLTNQFVAGRRTRYLHPLRLYLLISIVFFLCAPSRSPSQHPAEGRFENDPEGSRQGGGGDAESGDPGRGARSKCWKVSPKRRKRRRCWPDPRRIFSTPIARARLPPGTKSCSGNWTMHLLPSWLKQQVREKIGPARKQRGTPEQDAARQHLDDDACSAFRFSRSS